MSVAARAEEILSYWFGPTPDDPAVMLQRAPFWFPTRERGLEIDAEIRRDFTPDYQRACRGELSDWTSQPRGRLALLLVLDQFPRHLFRDHADAFAQDPRALAIAQEGVELGVDRELRCVERVFFYMPFKHSEELAEQQQSVARYTELAEDAARQGLAGFLYALESAKDHLTVIERFGRFPHRNAALGRASTPEEIRFLTSEPQPARPAEEMMANRSSRG